MSKSKLDILQARQCRGEELRLGFMLAALKAAPAKPAASARKSASRRTSAGQRLAEVA